MVKIKSVLMTLGALFVSVGLAMLSMSRLKFAQVCTINRD